MGEVTKHYLISGRVQGVGFRAFTRAIASEFNLVGWVRNLHDGRVEAMVTGTAVTLNQFEAKLRQGPAHGRVDNLIIKAGNLKVEALSKFEVRKDNDKPWDEN